MTRPMMNPETLAERLDDLLPANSGLVLDSDADTDSPQIDVAKMLAAYSNESMGARGNDLLDEQMMVAMDKADTSRWRSGSPRLLLAVASVILIAGCSAIFALGLAPQPVNDAFANLFAQEADITAEATEELLVSATPTDEPTITSTDVPATITPTVIPATATPILEPTMMPEAAFVQADGVRVREEPSDEADIIAFAERNDAVVIVGVSEDETWSQVIVGDGTTGWIASDLLGENLTPAPAPIEPTAPVISEDASTSNDSNDASNTSDSSNNDGDTGTVNPPPPPPPPPGGNDGNGGNDGGGRGDGNGGRGGRGGRGGN